MAKRTRLTACDYFWDLTRHIHEDLAQPPDEQREHFASLANELLGTMRLDDIETMAELCRLAWTLGRNSA